MTSGVLSPGVDVRGLTLAAVLAAFALARPVAAAPTIDIRAQTQVQLERVLLRGDGLAEVSGQLLDKLTGDGIGGQTIEVKLGGQTVTVTTQPDGRFRTTVRVGVGPQPVELMFRGGGLLEAAHSTMITDPSRAQVTLSIEATPAPAGLTIVVTATADDAPVTVPVALALGPAFAPLATIDAGTPFLLTRARAGGAGPRRIRATFAGDDARQTATAEIGVELTAETTTEMKVSATDLAFEDDLVVTGRVRDSDGAAVPRAAVTLVSGDRRLAQGATGDTGTFRFEVEAEVIGEGQFAVQVQAEPGAPAVRPSRSTPAIVKVAPPQPVPVSYTIAAFAATALAAGAFFLARAKPWRRLRRPAPPAEAPATHGARDHIDGGLVTTKAGVMSTLRRPGDDGFAGVVRDTVRGRPVGEAVVRLLLGEEERETRTADDGSFTLERLTHGEWRAEVAAPGHVTERFGVSIPHRGELRGVRVDLVPVRERVFQLYRRAAEPALPEPRLWGIWSPRQIVDHVRDRRPSPALADLTDFVEEIYFSGRLAPETVLTTAGDRVERAVRERTPRPPAV